MLAAHVADGGEAVESPLLIEFVDDLMPQAPEAVVALPGLRELEDVRLDELDPVVQGARGVARTAFVVEAFDGVAKWQAVELRKDGRGGGDDGFLLGRLGVAHPAELPTAFGGGVEGVHGVRRQQARGAGGANLPTAIDEDLAAAAEAGEEVGAALVLAHDAVGDLGVRDADMGDLVQTEGIAHAGFLEPGSLVVGVCAHDALMRVISDDVRFR